MHPLDCIHQNEPLENHDLEKLDVNKVGNDRWVQLNEFAKLLWTNAPTDYPETSQVEAVLQKYLTLFNIDQDNTAIGMAVLQAELLREVRRLLPMERTPNALTALGRVARLWGILTPAGRTVDEHQRWWPSDPTDETGARAAGMADVWLAVSQETPDEDRDAIRRAVALVERISRLSELRYSLLFPVVVLEKLKNGARRPIGQALVRVRVALVEKQFYPERTDVLLAPWTRMLPDMGGDKGFIALQEEVGKIPFLKDHAILLDFQPLEANEGPPELRPWWQFEGGSLGLSIVLATWAAIQRRELKPVIATGVLCNNRIHPVDEDTISHKAKAVLLYQKWLGRQRPNAMLPEFLLPEQQVRQLTAEEQRELRVRAVPTNPLQELETFWNEQVSIGFTGYLPALREAGRKSDLPSSAADEIMITSDFNDDPEPLAYQRLLQLAAADESSGRVPLLVRWDRFSRHFGEIHGELEEALRAGWRLFQQISGLKNVYVEDDELSNAVRHFRERLALVVYGAPSLQLPAYEPTLQEALTRLYDYAHAGPTNDRLPQVRFVASDLHHEEFIREQWRLGRRFGPKAPEKRT